MPKLIRILNTAYKLSLGEWFILLKAWTLMFYIRLKMDHTPFKHWKHWLVNKPSPLQFVLTKKHKQDLLKLGQLINLASRYHPLKANCLPKSLAMKWMLEKNSIPSDLRVGLKIENKQIKGHAWLVINDLVINDANDIDSHYPIKQKLSHSPRWL